MPAQRPPLAVPLGYLFAAHAALAAGAAILALHPGDAAGFIYNAPLIGLVHLLTLGWITGAILGLLPVAGSLSLRAALPSGRTEAVACGLFVIGVAGMASHFRLDSYEGMAWSGGCVVTSIALTAVRSAPGVARARAGRPARAAILLAFANVLAAGAAGLAIGLDRARGFLAEAPGAPILPMRLAFAHAHLAAIGWALLMIVGIGSRMIPMILPAPLRDGPALWPAVILLEASAAGLFVALGTGRWAAWPFAVAGVAGLAAFALELRAAAASRLPSPRGTPSPDPALIQVGASFFWLFAAAATGLFVLAQPDTEFAWALRGPYGVFGLVGGLGQLVAGVGGKLIPIWSAVVTANRAAEAGGAEDLPSAAELRRPRIGWLLFALWNAATAALAGGMFLPSAPLVSCGAILLLAATVASALQTARALGPAIGRSTSPRATGRG